MEQSPLVLPHDEQQLVSPEAQAVAGLTATTSEILDGYGLTPQPQEDGTLVRRIGEDNTNLPTLVETTTVGGEVGYRFTRPFDTNNEYDDGRGDRGVTTWSWTGGASTVAYRHESEQLGVVDEPERPGTEAITPEEEIVATFAPDQLEGWQAGKEAQREEARRQRVRAERAAMRAEAARPRGPMRKIGREGREERAGAQPTPTPAEIRKQNADQLTGNLEWLATDERVVWVDGGRKYPHSRSTHVSAPGRKQGERLAGTVRIVDEPGKPRWYVLDMHVVATNPGRLGRPVTTDAHSALLWQKDGPHVLSGIEHPDGGRTIASTTELAAALHLTDPEISRARRAKPSLTREQVAELPASGKVAHYLGRMVGKRNVTKF